jgi:DNA-binding NarL/FixJ family response regulator
MTGAGCKTLTPREYEIFAFLSGGHCLKHICERQFISLKTFENHRTRLMRELGARSSLTLIPYAVEVGIIDIDL